jgi:hypothetical protein
MQSQERSTKRDGGGAGYRSSAGWRIFTAISQALDQRIGWDKLPLPLGLPTLVGVRTILRQENLYDTTNLPAVNESPVPPWSPTYLTARSSDGTYNDLDNPKMGRAGSRFGRNVPLEHADRESPQDLMSPNPRTVSRELMTRHEFQAAPSLNAFVAAWLQFMIRDWFNHGKGADSDVWEVPLVDADPWPEHPMLIPKVPTDPTQPPGSPGPPTYINAESHWWDGSQLYGNSLGEQMGRRTKKDGKLLIGDDGRLALPSDPSLSPVNVPGWWLGLSLLGSLFML